MRRKGLSPLVASVVLISATILGGMLVYQYFQNSITKAQTMAKGIQVTADYISLSANKTLIDVTVTNNYDKPIQVTAVNAILQNGTSIPLNATGDTRIPTTIAPSEKNTLVFTSNTLPVAVTVEYQVDGNTYQSQPIKLG